MIRIKRVYDPADKADGYRILVDRLWPRGLSKETANIDLWLKEIAPSPDLRKWFDHDPKKWKSFNKKYRDELKSNAKAVTYLRDIITDNQTITLLYGAKDEVHNQAIVLRDFLGNRQS